MISRSKSEPDETVIQAPWEKECSGHSEQESREPVDTVPTVGSWGKMLES